eukprot:6039586-Amphidinium_carterae.1
MSFVQATIELPRVQGAPYITPKYHEIVACMATDYMKIWQVCCKIFSFAAVRCRNRVSVVYSLDIAPIYRHPLRLTNQDSDVAQ